MHSSTPKAIAAIVVAVLGVGALAPSVFAEDKAGMQPPHGQTMGHGKHQNDRMGMQGRGGILLDVICSPKGATRLERMMDRVSGRLNLTETQKPLFDSFKTSALTAQTTFADSCTDIRPDRQAAGDQTMLDRLHTRLKLDEARLTALNTVLPDLEALYNSFSDEQKTMVEHRLGGGHRMGMGRHMRMGDRLGMGNRMDPNGMKPAPQMPATPTKPS